MRPLQRRKRRVFVQPEISLTPLIDTALTLLIIFMVTTPMIHNSIKVALPKGQLQEGGKDPQKVVVTIDKDGKIYCNNRGVALSALENEIQQCALSFSNNEEKSVWVKADGQAVSANLISVIECVKGIKGFDNVTIATEKSYAKAA